MNPCIRLTLGQLAVLAGLAASALPPAAAEQTAAAPAPTADAATAATRGADASSAGAPRTVQGRISYYGRRFAGRPTASGEPFDPAALTMAHRSLPFGTRVRITNPRNGRSVLVVVNDRGPAVRGRIADVSLAAARQLGMVQRGVIRARLEVLADPAAGPAAATGPEAAPALDGAATRPP